MAATHTLAQLPQSHKRNIEPLTPRHGVVSLFGYGSVPG